MLANDDEAKIFCISVQRTGTTSVGAFFKHYDYRVAGWPVSGANAWGYHWYNGDFESIFSSGDFRLHQVFEDDPWWLPDFYKVVYHRFPNAKFILFTRDSDSWFASMMKHSGGRTIGNTRLHCKMYRREKEFYHRLDYDVNFKPHERDEEKLMWLTGMGSHYKAIYELHNREVVQFFNRVSPGSLFVGRLEDPDKWRKLGEFVGIDVHAIVDVHVNKSV